MQVHFSLEDLPDFKNAVLTIGTFDGVHTGHQKIIEALKVQAAKIDGETVVITFHPHPRKIVTAEPLQLINTLEERIALLEIYAIDHLIVIPFTNEFADQSAEAYIEDFLIKYFKPHSIVIGYDHRFGKDRKGNYSLLELYSSKCGFNLIEIPKHVLNEIAISSTKIRNALLSSDIETANSLLGYYFFFSGKVVSGDQLGRTLNYPTANLTYTDNDKINLGHGVYAVYVTIDGKEKKGMLSIGNRPTINNKNEEKIEVNIFDFDASIYGSIIKVSVKKYLRKQEKYATLEALKVQLAKDKEDSLLCL
ncbi:MAG TPA: riboflavin biosynthesis protein RibF [Chitinophagaceae bacterium]|nr:riboflavin biosynthesis protein RibF [Chitinophagaceae bacterium]